LISTSSAIKLTSITKDEDGLGYEAEHETEMTYIPEEGIYVNTQ